MNNLFMVVLGLSLLVDLALGAWAGANFPHFARTWGLTGVPPAGVAHFFGWVLGTCLVGFAAIQGMAFHWTRRDKDEGPQLAIVFGCWLVLSSIATFAMARGFGSEIVTLGGRFLLVDGLRGAALAVLGLLALRAPSVVRELRLPDGARQPRHREERPDRPRHERGHDRSRRSEGGRESGREVRRGAGREDARRRVDADRPAARDRDREDARGERHGEESRRDEERGRGGQRRDEPRRDGQRRDGQRRDGQRRDGQRRDGQRHDGRGRHEPSPDLPDLESQAVAEARRILPDTLARPLTVVVKGAPERIRSLGADEGRSADEPPVSLPASEAIDAEDRNGRRRRRRRRRGGGGLADAPFEDGAASGDYDVLDEPVAVVREIEGPVGEDSGEGQEGAYVVRGRSRRRHRQPASRESYADRTGSRAEEQDD